MSVCRSSHRGCGHGLRPRRRLSPRLGQPAGSAVVRAALLPLLSEQGGRPGRGRGLPKHNVTLSDAGCRVDLPWRVTVRIAPTAAAKQI
jgi:hypothetical protein